MKTRLRNSLPVLLPVVTVALLLLSIVQATATVVAAGALAILGIFLVRPDVLGTTLARVTGLPRVWRMLGSARIPVAAAALTISALGLLRESLVLGRDTMFPSWVGVTTLLAAAGLVIITIQAVRDVPARPLVATTLSVLLAALLLPAPAMDYSKLIPINQEGQQRVSEKGMLVGQGAEINGYDKRYIGREFNECDQAGSDGRDCFRTYFIDLALKQGFNVAVDSILEKTATNQGFHLPSHCHEVLHELGKAAAYVVGIAEALTLEPQICGTGFTHGVFQRYWGGLSDEELRDRAPTICTDLGATNPFHVWTCHHILGHTILARDMSTPELATDACMRIEGAQQRGDCLTGAWMEFFSADAVAEMLTEVGDPAKVVSYCLPESAQSRNLCFHEVFSTFARMARGNEMLSLQWCDQLAPTRVDKIRCIEGVGRGFAVGSAYRWQLVAPKCSYPDSTIRDHCIAAAAASVVLNTGSLEGGNSLCAKIEDKEILDYCTGWARGTRVTLEDGPNKENIPD